MRNLNLPNLPLAKKQNLNSTEHFLHIYEENVPWNSNFAFYGIADLTCYCSPNYSPVQPLSQSLYRVIFYPHWWSATSTTAANLSPYPDTTRRSCWRWRGVRSVSTTGGRGVVYVSALWTCTVIVVCTSTTTGAASTTRWSICEGKRVVSSYRP